MTASAPVQSRRWPGVAWLAVAIVIWFFPNKAIQDVLLWVAFLYAVWRERRIPRVWVTFPGVVATGLVLLSLALIPFSDDPHLSGRGIVKVLDAMAVLYAVPVLLPRREDIARAMFWSGVAFSLVVSLDLLRLLWFLGPDALDKAHEFEPFMVTHSNISAVLAAVGCLTMGYFALRTRRDRSSSAMACALLCVVDLAYLVVIASRGPQIAFAAALAGAGFLAPRWSMRAAWLVVLVVAASLLVANIERINPRFADKQSLKTFVDRDKVWRHTWKLIRNRPVCGHGVGKGVFMKAYHEKSSPPRSRFHFQHPHQYWLYVLFAQGAVGALGHLVLWAGIAWRLLRGVFSPADREDGPRVESLLLVLCLCLHVYALADWPVGVLHLYLAWLIPAALVATQVSARPTFGGSAGSGGGQRS